MRWPDILDVFPSPNKQAARSYNALARLVVFGGATLYYVRKEPMFLLGTGLLLLYLFGEQDKYREAFYMTALDKKTEDTVAPPPDPKAAALVIERQTFAQRMVHNPRDIGARPAIVPTVNDKILASRPNFAFLRFPDWMSGKVGAMKSFVKPE